MDNFIEGKGNSTRIDSVTPNLISTYQPCDILACKPGSKETSKLCIKHPKLVKILDVMRQTSPQRLARDKEQPVSGCIQEILQRRLDKRVGCVSASSDSSPNQAFRQLKTRIDDRRTSVLLNLCKNTRFMKNRICSSE